MRQRDEQKVYEPPTLKVLGSVHALTEGTPGGPLPDCLNVNHNTVSGPNTTC